MAWSKGRGRQELKRMCTVQGAEGSEALQSAGGELRGGGPAFGSRNITYKEEQGLGRWGNAGGFHAATRAENAGSRVENVVSSAENAVCRIENAVSRVENTVSRVENAGSSAKNARSLTENAGSRVENAESKTSNARTRVL
jgi:hypothetical protein